MLRTAGSLLVAVVLLMVAAPAVCAERDLTQLDVCRVVPGEDAAQAIGVRLIDTRSSNAPDGTLAADNDKTVDYDDLVCLAANIGAESGASWTTADFTADGRVDADDYIALKRNMGLSMAPPAAGGQSVPEPATVLLLAAGAAAIAGKRQLQRGLPGRARES